MNSNENDTTETLNKLTDDEFAALVLDKYSQEKKKMNEVDAERVWQKLSPQLSTKRPEKERTSYPWTKYALIASIFLSLVIGFKFLGPQSDFTLKGTDWGLSFQLTAFLVDAKGEAKPIRGEDLSKGDRLAFSLKPNTTGYFALIIFKNEQLEVAVAPHKINTLEDEFVRKNSGIFAYERQEDDLRLKVCGLLTADESGLIQLIDRLKSQKQKILEEKCIVL